MSRTTAGPNTLALSYLAAAGLIGALVATVLLHKPPFWAMAAGTGVALVCAAIGARLRDGRSASRRVFAFALHGVARVLNVMVLIALINAMTAVWFCSGTIQGLVFYGLAVVTPRYVALAGLVLSTLLCTLIGSSVGTVATVGVAIMGIARALGVPPGPVAGAVMSGAIFGDRVSFLSPIYHLTVELTGSDPRRATKRLLATGWPSLAACGAFALALGFRMDPGQVSRGLAWSAEFLAALGQAARISPWVLLPPGLVIVLAMRKVPVRLCLAVGLAAAASVAVFYQHETLLDVLRAAALGYAAKGADPRIASLLKSGGLWGATNMLLLLLFAGMYTGIMESSGMMDNVSRGLVSRLRTRGSFLVGAMGVSVFSATLASNQAMAVIIPARAMDGKRQELGVPPEEFAGALGDSGVAAAGIIPWNVMAVMCSGSLQVPPVAYAPYTALAFALPIAGLCLMFRSGKLAAQCPAEEPKEKIRDPRL